MKGHCGSPQWINIVCLLWVSCFLYKKHISEPLLRPSSKPSRTSEGKPGSSPSRGPPAPSYLQPRDFTPPSPSRGPASRQGRWEGGSEGGHEPGPAPGAFPQAAPPALLRSPLSSRPARAAGPGCPVNRTPTAGGRGAPLQAAARAPRTNQRWGKGDGRGFIAHVPQWSRGGSARAGRAGGHVVGGGECPQSGGTRRDRRVQLLRGEPQNLHHLPECIALMLRELLLGLVLWPLPERAHPPSGCKTFS